MNTQNQATQNALTELVRFAKNSAAEQLSVEKTAESQLMTTFAAESNDTRIIERKEKRERL
jgi:ABC-type Zn uptake system ZnuABC Zn-binding protein ZnuA